MEIKTFPDTFETDEERPYDHLFDMYLDEFDDINEDEFVPIG